MAIGLMSMVNPRPSLAVDHEIELVPQELPVGVTVRLDLDCDDGMVWRYLPKLAVRYSDNGQTLDATEGIDYTIHDETWTASTIEWRVTAHTLPVAGSTNEWEADAFGVCTDGQPEQNFRPRERSVLSRLGSNLKTTFSKFTDIFTKRDINPVSVESTQQDAPGYTSADGKLHNYIDAAHKVRLLMCNFGAARVVGSKMLVAAGDQPTYVDETTGVWYYPVKSDKHWESGAAAQADQWKAFRFPIPASDQSVSYTPGCGKALASDPYDRPMFFATAVSMQSGCSGGWKYLQWTVLGNYMCNVANGPRPTATVTAMFGPSKVQGGEAGSPISVWVDNSTPKLPAVSAPIANLDSVEPFLSSSPTAQRLGIFEGATDANYVTVQGQAQVVQRHSGYNYLYPPTPIFGDTVGNGYTNVGYVGVRQMTVNGQTSTAIEKSIPNSGPGDSSVFREAVPTPKDVTVDGLRTVQWQLTAPTSTRAPRDGVELQTTVSSMSGSTPHFTGCVDIWAGSGNWATRNDCPGMLLNGKPAGGSDPNFASLFAVHPVHPVFDTGRAGRVYFSSVIPGQQNQCLTRTSGTTEALAPCQPNENANQQFDIVTTYKSGAARTDGAVKIVNVATGLAMAPRNDGSTGVDIYANPGADQAPTAYADYVWWRLRAPAMYVS